MIWWRSNIRRSETGVVSIASAASAKRSKLDGIALPADSSCHETNPGVSLDARRIPRSFSMQDGLRLPKRSPGRKSEARQAEERAADQELCNWIEARWRDTGLAFGARGWAYVFEGEGFIAKGEFDAC